MRYSTVISDPDGFFASEEWRRATVCLIIIGVVGVLNAISVGYPASLLGSTSDSVGTTLVAVSNIVTVVVSFLSTFGFWFLIGLVMYLIEFGLVGSGDLRSLLLAIAWGYVPLIFAKGLLVVVTIWTFSGISLSADPTVAAEQIVAAQQRQQFKLVTMIRGIFLLWASMIWYFALRRVRQLSPRYALAVVSAPTVGYLYFIFKSII